MRYSLVFIFILLITSCDYFNVKKISSEAILKEELETLVNAEEKDYEAIEAKDKEIEEFIQPIVMKMYEAAQQAQQAAQGQDQAPGGSDPWK